MPVQVQTLQAHIAMSQFLTAVLLLVVVVVHAQALVATATPEWQLPVASVPVPAAEGGHPSSHVPAEATEAAQNAARIGMMRVTNEAEFSAAMDAAVRHIIIESHLDLRGFPTLPSPPTLFELGASIQSIQVRQQAVCVLLISCQAHAHAQTL